MGMRPFRTVPEHKWAIPGTIKEKVRFMKNSTVQNYKKRHIQLAEELYMEQTPEGKHKYSLQEISHEIRQKLDKTKKPHFQDDQLQEQYHDSYIGYI